MNACEEDMNAKTPVDSNKDIALQSYPEEVSDACHGEQWSNGQSNCPFGTGIKVNAMNGSLHGRVLGDDTTKEAEEPSDEQNQNFVDKEVNTRRRKDCIDGVEASMYNEVDENISKDEFETSRKKEKPTKLETEESRNSKDANLNMNSKNSKSRKRPIKDDVGDIMMMSSDEEIAEKPTQRKAAKVSKARNATTASSSKAKTVDLTSTDESMDNPVKKEAAEQICIDDSDELTICDDASASRSRNKRATRKDSAEMTSSVYPRRIVPPLSKGKIGRRAIKSQFETRGMKKKPTKLEDLKEESRNSKDANLSMKSENSKRRKLPVRDNEYDWRDFIMASSDEESAEKPTKRKEAKVSKAKSSTTASSSKTKSVELASIDKSKYNLAEAEMIHPEEQRLREEEYTRGKLKRVRQRVQEEGEKAKLEERNGKPRLAFEQTWREKIRTNEKQRQAERIETISEGPRHDSDVPSVELAPDRLSRVKQRNVEALSDIRRRNSAQPNQFPCPVCGKNFPAEEIEFHAAGCEHYGVPSSAGGSGSNSPVVPMSLRPPTQRDIFLNIPRKTGLQDQEFEKRARRKEAKIAIAKKPTTASSSKTKSVELVWADESKYNLAKAKLIHQAERRIRDEAAAQRKEERVKQRVKEQAKKAKLHERNEKLKLSFAQNWMKRRKVLSLDVATENHSGLKQRDVDVSSDDWRGDLSHTDRVLCPICGKDFSIEQIEIHASHCEQFDADSSADRNTSNSSVVVVSSETPEQRDTVSTLLTCDTCWNFTTRNRRELEDHVAFCLARQSDDILDGSDSVVIVSNSPVVPMPFSTPKQRVMLSNMPRQAELRDDEVAEGFESEEEIVQPSLVDSGIEPGPSRRLRRQRERLRSEQQKEDEVKLVNLEEQRARNEEETGRKAERVKRRLQDAAKKTVLGTLIEKQSLEIEQTSRESERRLTVEETCREKVRTKAKERRTERQRNDVPSTEVVPANHSGMKQRDVEQRSNDRRNLSQTEQFPCPICGINFNVGEIETHASRCVERASASSSRGSASNSPVVPMSSGRPKQRGMLSILLQCYMCSKFTSRNGWEYESHVTSCLARQRELRESLWRDTGL